MEKKRKNSMNPVSFHTELITEIGPHHGKYKLFIRYGGGRLVGFGIWDTQEMAEWQGGRFIEAKNRKECTPWASLGVCRHPRNQPGTN